MRRFSSWYSVSILSMSLLLAAVADARSLLLISIDGMRPDSVLDADAQGLNVPNLRRFLSEGSYARGVRGVVPTITYPSHTTLVTGVTPAEHGILSNDPFDPLHEDPGASYYYAADVKVDTLWDAVARAGRSVGAVAWPETVGARTIQYNLPHLEPYRSENTVKMQRALSRPDGLLADLESTLGTSYFQEGSESGSRIRTDFSIEIMRRYKPQFMLVHLVAVDYPSHRLGPFSAEAKRALEAEDAMIGELIEAMRAYDTDMVVAIVSDHGQVPVTRALNLRVPFIEAGLLKIDPPQPGQAVRVVDWQADIWPAGGSAAVMLKNPQDAEVRAKVAAVLHRLAADPNNGINSIIEGPDVAKLGGWPASFVVDMKPGTAVGSNYLGDTLVTYPSVRGTHGYLPTHSGMNAAFFIKGAGIKKKQDLGVIDMRQIAPTLAQAMGVTLKDAKQPVLPVFADSPKRN
jgi:predicted AlkP superfamily pyrophosphatase or phosphodiesterase